MDLRKILRLYFSGFKWFRKWHGGHWERWYIALPINSFCWIFQEEGCFNNNHNRKPELAYGMPKCETWKGETKNGRIRYR